MEVSSFDKQALKLIRESVRKLIHDISDRFDEDGVKVLDVAPQRYNGAAEFFRMASISTLDIDESSGADYVLDITHNNRSVIPDGYFDVIICTEVLEHTLNPFLAVQELYRLVREGGCVAISTPFNFRIHGPLPDCWRFTEYGLRQLLDRFKEVSIKSVDTQNRFLAPIHYRTIAVK